MERAARVSRIPYTDLDNMENAPAPVFISAALFETVGFKLALLGESSRFQLLPANERIKRFGDENGNVISRVKYF